MLSSWVQGDRAQTAYANNTLTCCQPTCPVETNRVIPDKNSQIESKATLSRYFVDNVIPAENRGQ